MHLSVRRHPCRLWQHVVGYSVREESWPAGGAGLLPGSPRPTQTVTSHERGGRTRPMPVQSADAWAHTLSATGPATTAGQNGLMANL